MTTENIIKSLKNGELDAGIISTPYAAAAEFSEDFLFNEELMIYSSEIHQDDKFVTPEDIDADKIWLLEEGNCLRKQFENICHLKENALKPKNLEFQASSIHTAVQMVYALGGITLVPELAVAQLSKEQKSKISRFRKPMPCRKISLIYYKPTYKQRILDELSSYIKTSLEGKLGFGKAPEDFMEISPQ